MNDLDYPAVYIEEFTAAPRKITPVETSIAAFAGTTPDGPNDEAVLVESFVQYTQTFGLSQQSLLGYSVRHFFDNGGRKAYIVSVGLDNVGPNQPAFEELLLPADKTGGLFHLDQIEYFNLLCVPGETNPSFVKELQKFCGERLAFLICDSPAESTFPSVTNDVSLLRSPDARNSSIYFPWVVSGDDLQPGTDREFPPSGFIAGIIARIDETRGVWRSTAGVEAVLNSARGVSLHNDLSSSEAALLNARGINCIRTFPIHGTVVWGGRTVEGRDDLASDWKYVSVRRTSLFIEQSLYRGLQWAVFEPNDEPLWAQIRLSVGDFMYGLFRDGAFAGLTAREAYFVKCDRSTTSQNDINGGLLNVLIGFAPVKPAEFVQIRIQLIMNPDDE